MAKTLDRGLENREIVLDILTEVLEQGGKEVIITTPECLPAALRGFLNANHTCQHDEDRKSVV